MRLHAIGKTIKGWRARARVPGKRLMFADITEKSIPPCTLDPYYLSSGSLKKRGRPMSGGAKSIPILAIDCDGHSWEEPRRLRNQKSSCRSETIFAKLHWNNKFPERLQPEMLGTCLQAVTDSSFSLFAYWQRGRESWLFGKLILRDSSILNPPRDTLFLWLVWRRH